MFYRWKLKFSPRQEIMDYFDAMAKKFNLYKYVKCLPYSISLKIEEKHIFPRHIRFNTEVLSCHWDEAGGEWSVKTKSGKDYRANILIPALGAFRKTRVPEFKVRKRGIYFSCTADGAVVLPWKRGCKIYLRQIKDKHSHGKEYIELCI